MHHITQFGSTIFLWLLFADTSASFLPNYSCWLSLDTLDHVYMCETSYMYVQ